MADLKQTLIILWLFRLPMAISIALTRCAILIFFIRTFNIFIGGFRVDSLADVAYQGDVTYGIGTTLMWAIAQISTGIIVACCPHLRPLFECMLPHRLTHLTTGRSKPTSKVSQASQSPRLVLLSPRDQSRAGSITVTTAIAVERDGYMPPQPPPIVSIHDG
ncbi:uncharacterized protein ALTATR162_LOCUS3656 [Alternaria atra]|uniref:Rhodopsin domain-containing protein n=1 Tax=Alternaria atra TaxID=119953 RepID=A0A8J2N463_9PLEO|nr:uncharacterized protein ALTATR162_LOCUS3656 [Alternaria atra]CAG5155426.1 unnamed protein product [Alternaria atra]